MSKVLTNGEVWRASVLAEFDQPTSAQSLVIDQIVCLIDELTTITAEIADRGPLVEQPNGNLIANPALASARQHRAVIGRLTASLGLEHETPGQRAARKAARSRWGQKDPGLRRKPQPKLFVPVEEAAR